MQRMALFGFLLFILWLFAKELKRRTPLSSSLWVVVIWLVIVGSRAVSTWFVIGRQVGGRAEAYDEGNPFERWNYFILIAWGVVTLMRRGVRLGEVIKYNKWLSIFFIYWLISVLWADLPIVAFKRWVKDLGNVVMVLVILTERDPVEAAKAVFIRCGCLLIPLSVLFIKYYPELGRAYHATTGEMMFTGVAAHKNTLGVLVMVCGLFLMWDFFESLPRRLRPLDWSGLITDVLLLGMAVWLLFTSHSATSLACAFVGMAIFFGLRTQAMRTRINRLEAYAIVVGGLFWFLNSVFSLNQWVVQNLLGRDMTLTTRTEIWPVLLSQADSPIFGAGFNSFWSGQRLEVLLGKYNIIQAHNGYLETYLNGGLIAVLLFVVLVFSASRRIEKDILAGGEGDFPVVRFMFLVIAIIHNFTEASINKGGLIWFVLLLALMQYPQAQTSHSVVESSPLPVDTGPASDDFVVESAPADNN